MILGNDSKEITKWNKQSESPEAENYSQNKKKEQKPETQSKVNIEKHKKNRE